jgi:hypothetical protein
MESRIFTASEISMQFIQHITNNIWAGICADNLFGPHILPDRLRGGITTLSWKTPLHT